MTKRKLNHLTYSLLSALLIAVVTFLVYVHDFPSFKEKEGFSGFSYLEVGIFIVSLFIISITGWIYAFIRSKGKSDRFVMLVPIIMLVFQLSIYVLDVRDSSFNEFNFKVVLSFSLLFIIVIGYFYLKIRRR